MTKKTLKNCIRTVILFMCFNAQGQIFYNSQSNNLRFAGALNSEVLALLSEPEKQLLNECITACGVHPDSVIWISKDTYNHLIDPNYYSTKMVYKKLTDVSFQNKTCIGNHKLVIPEFMVFIDRYNGVFEITLQMYY